MIFSLLIDLNVLNFFADVDTKFDSSPTHEAKNEEEVQTAVVNIRDKLQSKKKDVAKADDDNANSDEEIEQYYLGKDKKEARKKLA